MKSSSRVRPQQVPWSTPTRLVGRRRGAGTQLRAQRTGLCVEALWMLPHLIPAG